MSDAHTIARTPVVLIGGGIGAGKSRVASLFPDRGFTLIDTDDVGRSVLDEGSSAVASVAALWPRAVSDGKVDRAELARIVFSDSRALAQLEAITHPEISRRVRQMIDAYSGPVAVEVPVMKVLNREAYVRLAVVADPTLREERAVERGGDRDDVRRRMAHQPSDDQWREWADHVVENTAAWATTKQHVDALIGEVLGDE